ncbi:MAG: hypothetical protein RLZZ292_3476 [Bacteroidota bacterium]|jgi:hypothetical protein
MVKKYIEGEPPQPESAPKENAVANLGGLFDTVTSQIGNLQEAFTRLFEQANLGYRVHTIVMSGSTTHAMIGFAKGIKNGETAFLLIDVDEETKPHRIKTTQEKALAKYQSQIKN